jgi:hypothetical protein
MAERKVKFGDLKSGKKFRCKHGICIVTDTGDAVRLSDGAYLVNSIDGFTDNTLVTPLRTMTTYY